MNLISKIHICLVFTVLSYSQLSAQSANYQSQVLFLYNFTKYISWPNPQQDFIIGVFGESPILDELYKLAKLKKTPDGRTIKVKKVTEPRDVRVCHIFYIPNHESKMLELIAKESKGTESLIVCERDGTTKKGAEINFYTDDNDRLKISISRRNVEQKKIRISGELMRLAELVD